MALVVAGAMAGSGAGVAEARTYRAKVVSVVDGDTVRVQKAGKRRTMELAGVDAAELRGADTCYGAEARTALKRLLPKGARVRVRPVTRRSAEIVRKRRSVNRALVKRGLAEARSAPGRLGKRLESDEATARERNRGRWSACAAEPQPAPAPGTPTPAPGSPAPQPTPAPAPAPADTTGQAAIDQMTEELRDGRWTKFSSSGDSHYKYDLDLCGDGTFRYRYEESYSTFLLVTQKFGNPWSVKEALIKADGSYRGAIVQGRFTYQRSYDNQTGSTEKAIDEPAEARLEWQNGQWYWDGAAAQHSAGQASCAYDP